eukprot:5730079-Amphidinium_carterae.1
MRYVSEKQFRMLREALWAQGLGLVQSISFGHDADNDPDDPDWGSSVIFARVQADLAQEVESLLANEVVPKGQRWDS